jgi:hypothetical protein
MAHRPATATLLCLALLGTGCQAWQGGPARATLHRFFEASRLYDRTAVARLAVAAFDPHVDGIITNFTTLDVSPPRRLPRLSSSDHSDRDTAASAARITALSLLESSAADGASPERVGEVALAATDLVIEAPVRYFDGRTLQKRFVVTLQQAVTRDGVRGGWIVTGIRESSSGR